MKKYKMKPDNQRPNRPPYPAPRRPPNRTKRVISSRLLSLLTPASTNISQAPAFFFQQPSKHPKHYYTTLPPLPSTSPRIASPSYSRLLFTPLLKKHSMNIRKPPHFFSTTKYTSQTLLHPHPSPPLNCLSARLAILPRPPSPCPPPEKTQKYRFGTMSPLRLVIFPPHEDPDTAGGQCNHPQKI